MLMNHLAAGPPHFKPQSPGIDEGLWSDLLAQAPPWSPPQRPLVVVSPHPDDEVLGAGGLIHSCIAIGRAVTIVSVTDGEAAYAGAAHADAAHADATQGLAAIRRKELGMALRKLATAHVAVLRLGIPDGKVADHTNKLRNALAGLLAEKVTLVAPFEADGHPDHDATGAVCAELAKAHDTTLVRYLIWRWHHGEVAPLRTARWAKFALSAEARRAKASAVQCFSSQLNPKDAAPIIPKHVLRYFERSYEAFVL